MKGRKSFFSVMIAAILMTAVCFLGIGEAKAAKVKPIKTNSKVTQAYVWQGNFDDEQAVVVIPGGESPRMRVLLYYKEIRIADLDSSWQASGLTCHHIGYDLDGNASNNLGYASIDSASKRVLIFFKIRYASKDQEGNVILGEGDEIEQILSGSFTLIMEKVTINKKGAYPIE